MSEHETTPAAPTAGVAKQLSKTTPDFDTKTAQGKQAENDAKSPIGDWQFELRLQEIIERAQRDADYLFHDLRGNKAFRRGAYQRPPKGRVAVRLDCKSIGERRVFDLSPENAVRLFV